MELFIYLNNEAKLSLEEAELAERSFLKKVYPKNTLLEKPGNFSKQVYFIEKGLVRAFYHKEEKDITHMIFDEGNFILAFESIFFNKAHPYGLEFLEETTLRSIPFQQLDRLCRTIPALGDHRLFVALKVISKLSDRLYSLQFHTAEQRYKDLLLSAPKILLRVPLGHIASYLGITQQTLSVIRAGR